MSPGKNLASVLTLTCHHSICDTLELLSAIACMAADVLRCAPAAAGRTLRSMLRTRMHSSRTTPSHTSSCPR